MLVISGFDNIPNGTILIITAGMKTVNYGGYNSYYTYNSYGPLGYLIETFSLGYLY